ncbi:unnamed protein product [Phytophthora lilii]|uniref:Unnamed protein product n=1 Tax=Phytophthora lilii TaxID=2077276 RepID=A0A9W6U216_9STRA|nr:unnamed protein product [Phytophthora lilii]
MNLDADGDVEMAVPQPVFEVVQAPRLSAWDQPSLISWVRQRRQYEAKNPQSMRSHKRAVTDEDLGLAITRRCSTLQNNHIPDMDKLFQDKLKMDLKIEDTDARILNYFVLFDQIVEDHGLGGILGSGRENEPNYDERMKLRCKYLLKNIVPEMLRLEMERLAITKPVLKKDDIALYEALVERAREQQHYHLLTAAGPVRLRKLLCVVLDGDTDEFLVGDTALKSLGINVDKLLEQLAAKVEPEHDEDDIAQDDILGMTSPDEITECLDSMLTNAVHAGFDKEHVAALSDIVKQEVNIWRTKLCPDPPAKLYPLRVVFKEDTTPYRTTLRQYSTTKTKFLSEYGKQLERFGLVVHNQSRWACAAIPIRKKGPIEEFRCVTDYRPMNTRTIPIAGAMPNLLVVIAKVKGACFFATFDLFKGFWQLLLHPDCREFFSFITHDTVYTPTRVPQGATDSPIHFQNQMQEVSQDMLYKNLLVWVDDIVIFAKTAQDFLDVIRKFFARLRDTAAALQKFLCASNWLREPIVSFAQHAAPLQAKLEAAFDGHSRKQRYAEGIEQTWTPVEVRQYRAFLACVANSTKLSFPSETAPVCVTTDASDRGWSLIVSQVEIWDDAKHLTEQTHELILCKGGMFKGAQLSWSIAEKEGYPII